MPLGTVKPAYAGRLMSRFLPGDHELWFPVVTEIGPVRGTENQTGSRKGAEGCGSRLGISTGTGIGI